MMLSYKVELPIVALQFLNEYFSKVFLIHSYTDFLTSRGHKTQTSTFSIQVSLFHHTFLLYKLRLISKVSSSKFYGPQAKGCHVAVFTLKGLGHDMHELKIINFIFPVLMFRMVNMGIFNALSKGLEPRTPKNSPFSDFNEIFYNCCLGSLLSYRRKYNEI